MEPEKKLYSIYFTFGKGEGNELGERRAIPDTPENRKTMIEKYSWQVEEDIKNNQDFINGKTDLCYLDNMGGDWDERTGTTIIVATKDETIKKLEETFKNDVYDILKEFE